MPYRVLRGAGAERGRDGPSSRAWARRRKTAQALALRARIVLRAAEGLSNTAIAAELGIAKHTVGKWRERFARLRTDGLLGRAPSRRARGGSADEQVAALVDRTLSDAPGECHALEPADHGRRPPACRPRRWAGPGAPSACHGASQSHGREHRAEGDECAAEHAEGHERYAVLCRLGDAVGLCLGGDFGGRRPSIRPAARGRFLSRPMASAAPPRRPAAPLRPHLAHSTAAEREPDDLHRNHLHDGRGGEDHRIADVGPLGRRHPRRVDQDGRIARRAGGDAEQFVIGQPHQIEAREEDDGHGGEQHGAADQQHQRAGPLPRWSRKPGRS